MKNGLFTIALGGLVLLAGLAARAEEKAKCTGKDGKVIELIGKFANEQECKKHNGTWSGKSEKADEKKEEAGKSGGSW